MPSDNEDSFRLGFPSPLAILSASVSSRKGDLAGRLLLLRPWTPERDPDSTA